MIAGLIPSEAALESMLELRGVNRPQNDSAACRTRPNCMQIWGGTRTVDLDVHAGGLCASVFSSACDARVGGDIYYFTVCDDDELTRLAIADVLGHGESVSAISQWMFEGLVDRMNALDGDSVLRSMNRLAFDRGIEATTTAAVVAYYRRSSSLYFSYAGHPPLLIRRRDDRNWSELTIARRSDPANLPLGILPDTAYDQPSIPFACGDRLVLYSDGVVEAPNKHGELFGLERLMDTLNHTADMSPARQKAAVLAAVRAHTGDCWDHDDVTLITAEMI